MDNETKEFIIEQHKEIESSLDKRFENTDTQIKKVAKGLTKRIDDQAEESRRYLGSLKEFYNDKLDTILEVVKSLLPMKEQVNIMFEHTGQQEMDITMVKESVQDHEHRIEKLEVTR